VDDEVSERIKTIKRELRELGEDVEQRRAYIEKHALEVKNLDV
jgi:DNA gyrase/topoisomerase IV subunit B